MSGANRALVASDQAPTGLGPSGFDHGYCAFYRMLIEQGVWADGHAVKTCGSTTGHFAKAIAYCDTPETAKALADAFAIAGIATQSTGEAA